MVTTDIDFSEHDEDEGAEENWAMQILILKGVPFAGQRRRRRRRACKGRTWSLMGHPKQDRREEEGLRKEDLESRFWILKGVT